MNINKHGIPQRGGTTHKLDQLIQQERRPPTKLNNQITRSINFCNELYTENYLKVKVQMNGSALV